MKNSFLSLVALVGLATSGCATTTAYSAPEAELQFREHGGIPYHEWSEPSEMSFEFAADEEEETSGSRADATRPSPAQNMVVPSGAWSGDRLKKSPQPNRATLDRTFE